MTTPAPVQPIRQAATIVIGRDDPDGSGLQVFMLRRTRKASFAGGMYVFPGGRVEGDDHLHAWDPYRLGPDDAQARQVAAVGNEWRGYWIAGVRETFEEAGLLLAYREDGRLVDWPDAAAEARFTAYRDGLNDGSADLLEICRQEGLRLACDRIHYFNRWVTPLGRPRRFDTRFFIAEAPPGQEGLHDDGETVESLWIRPPEALQRHAAGDFGLMGVTVRQLDTLAEFDTLAALTIWAETRTEFPVYRPVLPPQDG